MESKIKHLEFIQNVISRMASNSFMLKGWAVTLVAAVFALSSKDADKSYFLVAYIPIFVFWFLDSYYLQQERLYRHLYDMIRQKQSDNIDFSLKATRKEFDNDDTAFYSCLLSKTELGFYLPLAVLCVGIIIVSVVL